MTNEEMIMNTNTIVVYEDPDSANDTERIQAAINNENYSTIILSGGTYRVSGLKLRSNLCVKGENATLKIIDDESEALSDAHTSNTAVMIAEGTVKDGAIVPIHDIEISGIHFDGNASYYMGCSIVSDSVETVLDVAANFISAGVMLQGVENIHIHHCTFEDFKNAGVYATYPTDFDYEDNPTSWCVHGLTITDCEFNKNGVPESRINPNHQPIKKESEKVEGEYAVAAPCRGIAILTAGTLESNRDITIERCIIHNAGEHGIVFYPLTENVTVRDCIVKNCGLYTGEEGATYTYTDDTQTTIAAVSGGDYLRKLDGEVLSHSAGCNIKLNTVRNCLVENCYLYGATSWGVSVYRRNGYFEPCNITIRNNIIEGSLAQDRTGSGVVCECGHNITVIGNTIRNHHLGDHTYHKAYPIDRDTVDAKRFYHSHAITLAKGHAINNFIEDCDHGISISNGTVVGNRIECGGTGLTIDQKLGNTGAVMGDGSYCMVSKNVVRKAVDVSALTSKARGIRLGYRSTSDRPCIGNSIYWNKFSGYSVGAEFHADSCMKNTTFLGNSFFDVTTTSNFGNNHTGTVADFTFAPDKEETQTE